MNTTVTIRPASTMRADGLVLTAPIHTRLDQALADNSDATFASTIVGDINGVRFAGYVLPIASLISNVVLRMRVRRPSPGILLFASLNDGDQQQFTPPTGALQTQSSPPISGFTNNAIKNGLRCQFISQFGSVDIAEAYLDITYVARPTVVITSPVATVGVTQPTVSWEMDGDFPQARWQVKIFSQAQYEAPGFDPDTSVAVFSTGEQLGLTAELVAPVNLTNGATYRFYVKAAQQVGSTVQYSTWAFTEEDIDVEPPAVPTVTAEAQNDLARIKVTVVDTSGSTGFGYGLGPYGSGPYGGTTGGDTPPWQFVTVERSTDGSTWVPVRSALRAPTFGDTFVVFDYETCNGQNAQYRAQAIIASTGGDVASDWSPLTAPVGWASLDTWAKSPTHPTFNIKVIINQIPTLKRRMPQTVLDVSDRADPVVVSDARKLVQGTVTFATLDIPSLDALLTLLDLGEPILLQSPPTHRWGCRYIAIGDVDETRQSPQAEQDVRLLDCPFVEVLAPAGDVVGFGGTWRDVLREYPTWRDLYESGLTWAQVLGLS